MTNAQTPAPRIPEWAGDFCKDYTLFLFNAGKWTLIAGILLGIALAIATVILLLRKKDGAGGAVRAANAGTATAALEAIKGFLQALSSAPTWLALFGGGVLLLWMAGNAVPEICKPQSTISTSQQGRPGGSSGSAQTPAGNDAAPTR